MIRRFLVLLILLSTNFSCNNLKYSNHQEKLNLMSSIFENKETIIVIPNEGCGGCISDAATFVNDNLNKLSSLSDSLYRNCRS